MPLSENKLFIVMLGGRPLESTIEQHNIYCGVGPTLESLYPAMKKFWSTAPQIHIDAYMVVEQVDTYKVIIHTTDAAAQLSSDRKKLFLMGLGGYRAGDFVEYHKYKLVVAHDMDEAKTLAKQDPFMQEGVNDGPDKAMPHVDSKQLLDTFEDDAALSVNESIEKQGFKLGLEETDSTVNPEVIITGYLLI